jgi:hypothetical protein
MGKENIATGVTGITAGYFAVFGAPGVKKRERSRFRGIVPAADQNADAFDMAFRTIRERRPSQPPKEKENG